MGKRPKNIIPQRFKERKCNFCKYVLTVCVMFDKIKMWKHKNYELEKIMENFGYVLATKMLVQKRLPVLFMYKEKGEGDDSGWRFFCGLEDQEYVDNPDNIAIYDIKTILDIDPSIAPYLGSLNGRAYEREKAGDPFKRILDYGFGE